MRHARLRLAVLLFAPLALGCALRVYTDHDAATDFARLAHFAWLEPPLRDAPRAEGAPPADPFTHNTLLDKRVRDAVEAALIARGYQRAEAGSADFLLRYEVVSREVVRDSPVVVGGGFGHRGYYGSGVGYSHRSSYDEGTLILDVIDAGSQRIAWRGWAASRARDGHFDARRVSHTVNAILAKFPPEAARAAAPKPAASD